MKARRHRKKIFSPPGPARRDPARFPACPVLLCPPPVPPAAPVPTLRAASCPAGRSARACRRMSPGRFAPPPPHPSRAFASPLRLPAPFPALSAGSPQGTGSTVSPHEAMSRAQVGRASGEPPPAAGRRAAGGLPSRPVSRRPARSRDSPPSVPREGSRPCLPHLAYWGRRHVAGTKPQGEDG